MGRYAKKTCYICGYQDTADNMVRKEYKRKRGETKDSIHAGTWIGVVLGDKKSTNRVNKAWFSNNKRSHYTNTPVWQCLECSGEGAKIRAAKARAEKEEAKRLAREKKRAEREARELERRREREEYERLNPPGPITKFFRFLGRAISFTFKWTFRLAILAIVVGAMMKAGKEQQAKTDPVVTEEAEPFECLPGDLKTEGVVCYIAEEG